MELKSFIIPAIDIKDGKVVRLLRGEFDKAKEYPYSPEELASLYNDAGIKRLHVVDLDGARGGKPANLKYISAIRKNFSGEIEVGGGVRSYDVARVLFEEGIDLVVVGTLALKHPEEFDRILTDYPNKVILSIDSKRGKVAVGGWTEESSFSPKELVSLYDPKPVWGYLYTIVERDGSLEGIDTKPYEDIKRHTAKPVLASGGVSSIEDIEKLYGLVDGVVVGKAIYEGRVAIEGLEL